MVSKKINVTPSPQVVFVTPQPIMIYQVTEEKLHSVKVAFGNVSQDFGFMTTSLGIFLTALTTVITLYHANEPPSLPLVVFVIVTGLAAIVALYTGIHWVRLRKEPMRIIDEILRSGNSH